VLVLVLVLVVMFVLVVWLVAALVGRTRIFIHRHGRDGTRMRPRRGVTLGSG
jgi:hypothetical protein